MTAMEGWNGMIDGCIKEKNFGGVGLTELQDWLAVKCADSTRIVQMIRYNNNNNNHHHNNNNNNRLCVFMIATVQTSGYHL